MKPTSKVIAAIATVIGSYFLVGFLISYVLMHPRRKKSDKTPENFGLQYKKVSFKSEDGINLAGWLIKSKNPNGTIIVSHGYGYCKADVLKAGEILVKNGYSVLVFDYRAHGDSEGKISGIGSLEVSDLLGAINYIKKTGENKIGLLGFSMGAATSIVAASKSNVKCVIADSGYSNSQNVLENNLSVLGRVIVKFLHAQGVDVNKNRPIDYVNKLKCPLLIIHCKDDKLVNVSQAKELYNKTKNKELWIIDYNDHAKGYYKNPKAYERKVLDFLGKCFTK